MSLPLPGSYSDIGGTTQHQQRGYNVGWIPKSTRPSGRAMSARTYLQTEIAGVNCTPDHGANLTELGVVLACSSHDHQGQCAMSTNPARLPRYAYVTPENAARHAKDTEDGLYNLLPGEIFWKERYFFLEGRGYTLRPRYHPEWKPSWIGTDRKPMFCEDSIILIVSRRMIMKQSPVDR